MLTSEILQQVRRIEVRTGKLVSETFSGEYLSVFKGHGMEFAEVREYVPGDEIRSIDWNVTARLGRPFIKRFVEERELTMMLACDISGSQHFGTRNRLKNRIAAELSALFAFSALQNNDKVGIMLFSDRPELYIPPRKGRKHVLRLIREILAHEPQRRGTDIGGSLDSLNRVLKRKGILILISDFVDGKDFSRPFKLAAKKHDLIPVLLEDPLEAALPAGVRALLQTEDPETGEISTWDIGSAGTRQSYKAAREARMASLRQLFASLGIDWIHVKSESSVLEPVVRFFRERARKLK